MAKTNSGHSGKVRLTGGELSGRVLHFPADFCHPMGERERLALFNRLGSCQNKVVLDLFSGSGALGFEALSRAAKSAFFVESQPQLASAIKTNLRNLNLLNKAQVYTTKVQKFQHFTAELPLFDLIFADPPYDHPQIDTLDNVHSLLSDSGILVLSHPTAITTPALAGLTPVSSHKYAACQLTFYQK